MASPKLVEPDRDEGAVHLETTPRVSEDSGVRVCFSAAGWFRHSRSLALTSWLNQHPVNKPHAICNSYNLGRERRTHGAVSGRGVREWLHVPRREE